MAKSKIAWTDYTFNPWTGCTKISPGCQHCYAETLSKRFGDNVWGAVVSRQRTSAAYWRQPHKWNRQAAAKLAETGQATRVFCGSMCDWAEERDGEYGRQLGEWREDLFDVVRQTPRLTWMLLTKRADRIAALLPDDWGEGWPNVWLGVSIENLDQVYRVFELKQLEAAVRFVSYEPALGSLRCMSLARIDWVIYGGESGAHYRSHQLDWARQMRDACRRYGVAFFFKQGPGPRPGMYDELDGEQIKQFPTPRVLAAEDVSPQSH